MRAKKKKKKKKKTDVKMKKTFLNELFLCNE